MILQQGENLPRDSGGGGGGSTQHSSDIADHCTTKLPC